MCMLIMYLYL